MFEDFIIEAVDRVLSWDISDEALSQAVTAQAALLSQSDQHCMVLIQ
jgi:hypothetical protein